MATAAAAAGPPAATPATPPAESTEREILVDAAGLRYHVEVIPKSVGTYRVLPDGRVRFRGGLTLELVGEDEQNLLIKVYEPVETPAPAAATPQPDPAAVAASYAVALPNVDRVTLVPFDQGLPKTGQWRDGFDFAHLDGDGHLDLVFGPARKGRPRPNLFTHDGNGTWKPAVAEFPPLPYDYGDVAAADFNGDGAVDLALAMHLRGIAVLVAEPGARFGSWSQGIELIELPTGAKDPIPVFSSRAVTVADWNGDGRLDVLAFGEGPKLDVKPKEGTTNKPVASSRGLRVYLNRGDGSWDTWDDPSAGKSNFTDSFAVGDLNRDGRLDVVGGTRKLGNANLLGIRQPDGGLTWEALPQVRPKALVYAVEVVDLDGDGWLDLAIAFHNFELAWRAGVDVFWGGPTGWQRQGLMAQETRSALTTLASGDLDGDGKLDLVGVDQDAQFTILLGDGKRGFVREESEQGELPATERGCEGSASRLLDLDRDGRAELVVSFAGEPTGLAVLTSAATAGCTSEGRIRVWSPRARVGPTTPQPSKDVP